MKQWIILAVLLAAFVASSHFLSSTTTTHKTRDLADQLPEKEKRKLKKGTLEPGRVVELQTTRGSISFVLFDKDCPKTCKQIAGLVEAGAYDGVTFPRVEDWLIQTDQAKKTTKPMGIEAREGLDNVKGSVGMARKGNDYNSNTSIFYILTESAPTLNGEYTVFGRVVKGMEAVVKMKKGDKIVSAKIRPLEDADRKDFHRALETDAKKQAR